MCASAAPLPPYDGMRLHLRTLVDALALDHDVTVLALRWPEQHGDIDGVELMTLEAPSPGLVEHTRDRLVAVLRRRPVDWDRLAKPFASRLPSLLAARRFDVVHVALDDLSGIAPLLADVPSVIAPLDARHLNIAAQAAQSHGIERLWRKQQQRAVRRALATALRPFGAAVFVTEEDAEAVRRRDPSLRATVIPIAVDAEAFAPPADRPPRDPNLIVFTGTLSAPANVEAAERLARRILPLVRRSVPDARLVLAGRAPGPGVRALGAVDGVEVVGDPPDMRPWLWSASAFACPMTEGTGMKNKLLEAMAAGAASVVTAAACRGLTVHDGVQLLRAETDQAVVEGLVRVLRDGALRNDLGEAARRYVVAHHAPQVIGDRFVSLYADVAASAGSG